MTSLKQIKTVLVKLSDPEKATHSARFFKAGKGEYAEGDKFIGVTVPEQRKVAKQFKDMELTEVEKLLQSDIHEHRLTALFLMVKKYQKSKKVNIKQEIVELYLKNRKYVNNWDLVDSSAHYILGPHLENKDRSLLYTLANSRKLWDQRIAVMSTFHFIKQGDFQDTLAIAEILLNHEHALIHKAVGWMLREIGKIDQRAEERFLRKHYRQMPRTMLRYAIEKFDEELRQKYLKGEM